MNSQHRLIENKARIKVISSAFQIFLVFLFVNINCNQQSKPPDPIVQNNNEQSISVYSKYSPVKIDIIPLTEFIKAEDDKQAEINLFVSLLDSFGSQIKSPCKFRFELYQRVQRSAEPKGKRVIIWPDIDITDPAKNNKYWRNFLRAYEFNLSLQPESTQGYILEVTCLCPNNKRLSAEFSLIKPE
jgi:hypothetical protein